MAADATPRRLSGTALDANAASCAASQDGPALSVTVVPTVPGGTARRSDTGAGGALVGATGISTVEVDSPPPALVMNGRVTPRSRATRANAPSERNRARRDLDLVSPATGEGAPQTGTADDSVGEGGAEGAPLSRLNAVASGEGTTMGAGGFTIVDAVGRGGLGGQAFCPIRWNVFRLAV